MDKRKYPTLPIVLTIQNDYNKGGSIMASPEYVQEQIQALKELFIWKHLNDEEKEELRQAQTEARANVLVRTFRDKYWDVMLAEFEKEDNDDEQEYLNVPILDIELNTKTTNALMRSGLYTSQKFVEFVKEHGWSKIKGFGCGCARDLYLQIYDDMSDEEMKELIKTTKMVKRKDLGRKI